MKLLAILLAFFVMGSAATAQNTRTLHEENPVSAPSAADEVMIYHGAGCLGKLICKTTFQSVFTSALGIPPGSLYLGQTANTGNTLVGAGAGGRLGASEHLVTAVGWNALGSNTLNGTAESTAVGWNSQGLITTGSQNTTLGVNTLGSCLTCIHDILIGTDSMRNPVTGNFNIGIGVTTLLNSADSNNIAIGEQVLQGALGSTGHDNIGIGVQAMVASGETSANSNVGIGTSVMQAITSALANVMIGHNAGLSLTVGLGDTGVGFQALISDAGNGVNTAYGYTAGKALVNGNFNVLIGAGTGAATLATGSNNVLVGYNLDTASSSTSNTVNVGGVFTATGIDTLSTSAASVPGTLNVVSGYKANGTAGVSCSGSPTSSFVSVNGIVTHC